jgi:hypothetical protein
MANSEIEPVGGVSSSSQSAYEAYAANQAATHTSSSDKAASSGQEGFYDWAKDNDFSIQQFKELKHNLESSLINTIHTDQDRAKRANDEMKQVYQS